jgi:hypothetical protein
MKYKKYLLTERTKPWDVYKIECRDIDGKLPILIDSIAKLGNTGHSFSIILDPDSSEKVEIGWDGDGADYINSIKKI